MTYWSLQMVWLVMGLVWLTWMVKYVCSISRLSLTSPVKFRMIVFRPFKGEIMLGKISSGTEHGIKSMFQAFKLQLHNWYIDSRPGILQRYPHPTTDAYGKVPIVRSSSIVALQYTNILIVTMQSKSGSGKTKTEQNSSSMWEKSSGFVLNQKSGTIRSPMRQILAMKLLQRGGLHIPFLLVFLSCIAYCFADHF